MDLFWTTLCLLLNISSFECAVKYTCSEDLCFYTNGLPDSSLSEARLQCRQNGSKLLELSEERVERVFNDVYKAWTDGDDEFAGYYVWLNLKSITFDWTWVNGIKYSGTNSFQFSGSSENYSIISYDSVSKNVNVRESSFNRNLPFICSSDGCEDSTCVSFHTSTLMNWFDARYECFKMGKDLAVLNWVTNFTNSLPELQLHFGQNFWLGLTRREFKWQESNASLKYHNWYTGQPSSNECVFLSTRTSYQWITITCTNENGIVICMKDKSLDLTTSSTQKPFLTAQSTSPSYSKPREEHSNVPSNHDVGLGIGLSLSILLNLGLLIGIYLYWKKTKSPGKSDTKSTSVSIDENTAVYEGINKNITSLDQPIYTPLSNVQ